MRVMSDDGLTIPRGKYIGRPIEAAEADHFYRCKACGAWIDCRDLGQVFEYECEVPHPASQIASVASSSRLRAYEVALEHADGVLSGTDLATNPAGEQRMKRRLRLPI